MRRVTVNFYDDLDWTQERKLTEAQCQLLVGLDGKWAELDLTEANEARVRALLGPLMTAGHAPEADAEQPPAPKRGRPRGYKISQESLDRGRAMRAFAQENGFRYITKTGKYYYSSQLIAAFEQHRAGQGGDDGEHRGEAVQEGRAGAAGAAQGARHDRAAVSA